MENPTPENTGGDSTPKIPKRSRAGLRKEASRPKHTPQRHRKSNGPIYQPLADITTLLDDLYNKKVHYTTLLPGNHNYYYARIKGFDRDVAISRYDANRSLPGDKVIVKLDPESKWIPFKPLATLEKELKDLTLDEKVDLDMDDKDASIELNDVDKTEQTITEDKKLLRPTGSVVYIGERNRNLRFQGRIRKNLFYPSKPGVPLFVIKNLDDHETENRIVLVEFVNWEENSKFPTGKIVESIPRDSAMSKKLELLITEFGIDDSPYPENCINRFNPTIEITPADLKERRDLRDQIIFSVDPPTARDIDDALSCEKLDNGNFRVGVHIADVSHYVKPDDPIDKIAKQRTTSFYFPHKVVPMLPEILSSNLCSLNGGIERFSYSVIWELSPDGYIESTWIGRTIIKSVAKLSYDHSHEVISNGMDNMDKSRAILKELVVSEKPDAIDSVVTATLYLNELSSIIRQRRFDNGTLGISTTKLVFEFEDSDYNKVLNFAPYEQKESNYMIEEFMIMANVSVAQKIIHVFPESSLLRFHPPPKELECLKIESVFAKLGFKIDLSSAEAITKSLRQYTGIERSVLEVMLVNTMNCALYYCTNSDRESLETRHYGLNIDLYTHFTSPIRRYPDIIVHRILTEALKADKIKPTAPVSKEDIELICQVSNDKKLNARKSSEKCETMFLWKWVQGQKLLIDDECYVYEFTPTYHMKALSTKLKRRINIEVPKNAKIVFSDEKYEATYKREDGKEISVKFLSKVRVLISAHNPDLFVIQGRLLWDDETEESLLKPKKKTKREKNRARIKNAKDTDEVKQETEDVSTEDQPNPNIENKSSDESKQDAVPNKVKAKKKKPRFNKNKKPTKQTNDLPSTESNDSPSVGTSQSDTLGTSGTSQQEMKSEELPSSGTSQQEMKLEELPPSGKSQPETKSNNNAPKSNNNAPKKPFKTVWIPKKKFVPEGHQPNNPPPANVEGKKTPSPPHKKAPSSAPKKRVGRPIYVKKVPK